MIKKPLFTRPSNVFQKFLKVSLRRQANFILLYLRHGAKMKDFLPISVTLLHYCLRYFSLFSLFCICELKSDAGTKDDVTTCPFQSGPLLFPCFPDHGYPQKSL